MRWLGRGRWWAGVLGAVLWAGCNGGDTPETRPAIEDPAQPPEDTTGNDSTPDEEDPPPDDEDPPPKEEPDSGTPDSGTPEDSGTPDSGTPDSGTPDSGTGGNPPDAGTPDGGTGNPGGGNVPPDSKGWRFLGAAQGAPREVLGVTLDEGGNLWVAGGEDGLCLLRPDASTFRCYTLADGLKPWAPWKGKDPAPEKRYLKVTAVTGGPAGTVWVGYQGQPNCESEFYKAPGELEDPAIFKSGDADRVELKDDGTLRVVHYDIHSPAHSVPGYGHREKLCTVNRIVWDKQRGSLWLSQTMRLTVQSFSRSTASSGTSSAAASGSPPTMASPGASRTTRAPRRAPTRRFSPPTSGSTSSGTRPETRWAARRASAAGSASWSTSTRPSP